MRAYITTTLVLLAPFFATANDEFHKFTNKTGKVIEAKIIKVKKDKVKLQRKDGKIFDTHVSIFSETDQDYIQEWLENDTLANIRFEVSSRIKRGKARKSESYSTEYKTWSEHYEVTVKNSSFHDIENLTVKYIAYMFDQKVAAESRSDGSTNRTDGMHTIEKLNAGKEASFSTKSFTIRSSDLKNGWYYSGNRKEKSRDSLAGLWVRVYRGDKLLTEYSSPKGLNKENWMHSGEK